jgi:TonB family protein
MTLRHFAAFSLLGVALAQQPNSPGPATLPPQDGSSLCTKDAYREKAFGSTTLLLEVDKKGKVRSAEVIKPFRDDLDKAAVKSAKEWRFPAPTGERLNPGTVQATVQFDCREPPVSPGGGVTTPHADCTVDPEPPTSEKARKAKISGTTVIWAIVEANGRIRTAKVAGTCGNAEWDNSALEAVKKWKFTPAKKDGVPVKVQVNIEVNFQLH